MTGLGDVLAAVRAMKAGALEYLEKPFTETALFAAISAAKGKSLANVPGPADPNIKEARARLATLSRREGQVLRGLARGDGQKPSPMTLASACVWSRCIVRACCTGSGPGMLLRRSASAP